MWRSLPTSMGKRWVSPSFPKSITQKFWYCHLLQTRGFCGSLSEHGVCQCQALQKPKDPQDGPWPWKSDIVKLAVVRAECFDSLTSPSLDRHRLHQISKHVNHHGCHSCSLITSRRTTTTNQNPRRWMYRIASPFRYRFLSVGYSEHIERLPTETPSTWSTRSTASRQLHRTLQR